jgi:hypothetical protein
MSENQGRRRFLEGAAALTGASWPAVRAIPVLEAAPVATGKATTFPKGFRWGAATASYQIEGAWKALRYGFSGATSVALSESQAHGVQPSNPLSAATTLRALSSAPAALVCVRSSAKKPSTACGPRAS